MHLELICINSTSLIRSLIEEVNIDLQIINGNMQKALIIEQKRKRMAQIVAMLS